MQVHRGELGTSADRLASRLFIRPHVKAQHDVLVTNVELPIGSDWMRPTILRASIGLVKTALFLVAVWGSLDQRNDALSCLAAEIEMAVGASERAFAYAFVAPNQPSGLEFLADPALAIRVAVEVLTHSHHAAVMVDHALIGINLPGLEGATGLGDLEQIAADAVAGRDVHVVIMINRRRHRGGNSRAMCAPDHFAGGRLDSGYALPCELDVLTHSGDFLLNRRGVFGWISPFAGLPEEGAGRLVQRHHRAARTARRADYAIPIHQRRFGILPSTTLPAKILLEVLSPDRLSSGCLEANQIAKLSKDIDSAAIDGGRAAGRGRTAAGLANRRSPNHLAMRLVQRECQAGLVLFARGEYPPAGH